MTVMDSEQKLSSADSTTVSRPDDAEPVAFSSKDDVEVFRQDDGAVNFRTVSWPMASVIFLKRRSNPILDR
jgi:hypothetical protein